MTSSSRSRALCGPAIPRCCAGIPQSRKFSVFHLRDGVVAGVEAVNAAPDYIVGRKLIAARARVVPERLADSSIPAKQLA